jgi:hypothetical protein
MAAAGAAFSQAGIVAVYCVHGTFCGNDALGLFTEIEGRAPNLTEKLRRGGKRMFDWLLGETGNYTPEFAARMEASLSCGTEQDTPRLPVRLFHWSSQNHHIARADGAVRLIDELCRLAEALPAYQLNGDHRPRVLLWSHSHGGNVFAILTNLLAADAAARGEFLEAARTFFRRPWSQRVDLPTWRRVEQVLSEADHPVRRVQLDFVTFGTPVRYGWDAGGYAKLLHIVNHRPPEGRAEHLAPYPLRLWRMLCAVEGDYIQQIGIAGTNLAPLPLAVRTFMANHRMGRLLQRNLKRESLRKRLKCGTRVHDEGATLLIDYDDPDRSPFRHLFGHAPYTRSRWMALHCELVARHFYTDHSPSV